MTNEKNINQVKISINGYDSTFPLLDKTFSSGSMGFFISGKVITDKGSYQCQCQAVLIGSKPKK